MGIQKELNWQSVPRYTLTRSWYFFYHMLKVAGNGISRRHTLELQSVKYSLLQYPKNPKVGPNWRAGVLLARVPDALKRGSFGFLASTLLQNIF